MTQHVVLLTGGALPSQTKATPRPYLNDIELALERAGVTAGDRAAMTAAADAGTLTPHSALLLRTVAEAFRIGYGRAAKDHRVVAAWVVADADEAARFAALVTEAVDPAHVMPARSALAEALGAFENKTGRVIA